MFKAENETIQEESKVSFSNYPEVMLAKSIQKVPFISVGKPKQGNITAKEANQGAKGGNVNSFIPAREGIEKGELKSGTGSPHFFSNRMSTFSIVILTLVGAYFFRRFLK